MPDFLLEIGCEEIPARMIDAGAQELRERVGKMLERERLVPTGAIAGFDTPRRLAVLASGIPAAQPDVTEQLTGPSTAVAYKDGQPNSAAHAFAKKAGVDVSQLEKTTTPKGEYLSARVTKKGRSAGAILAELLPKEISSLYWPKSMYWRKPNERFVRPVRWMVALLDGEVIPLEFDGIRAGNSSRGHRILADNAVAIPRAGTAYVDALAAAKVLNRADREQKIRKALDAATRKVPGARWREDKALLDTVVNLTEFPSAILGNFDPQFLELPEEVLVTVMRDHQKYFAVEDASGKLAPHFLAVLNTDGDRDGTIQHGNERVLRARFNDARFFWQTDQKISLRDRLELLKHVTFQKDLGSYYDKTIRTQRLASWLSETLKQAGVTLRPGVIHKAACLAKTDLTTELVKEFTELQGIVGGLYARVQVLDEGLSEDARQCISTAIYDHYKPESMDDTVPRTVEGAVLSIADKADSIAGMFALGLVPSGSKDPFGLRRQANGIVKTIAEHKLPMSINLLMLDAYNRYKASPATSRFSPIDKYDAVATEFFRERLDFYMRDAAGIDYDTVNAVLNARAGFDNVVDALARAKDVTTVRASNDFQAIAVAFKRTKNILKQATESGFSIAEGMVQATEYTDAAERSLADVVFETLPRFKALVLHKDYAGGLHEMAKLRGPLDKFFLEVMVMVDDDKVRSRRLALLNTILRQFSSIADFSEIVTDSKESKESSKQ
jgi:glycyl-tRNA synthetase beta chain